MNNKVLAFIGGGNMASAIIGGLRSERPRGHSVVVVEPFDAQRDKLHADFGVHALAAADASLAKARWSSGPSSRRCSMPPPRLARRTSAVPCT